MSDVDRRRLLQDVVMQYKSTDATLLSFQNEAQETAALMDMIAAQTKHLKETSEQLTDDQIDEMMEAILQVYNKELIPRLRSDLDVLGEKYINNVEYVKQIEDVILALFAELERRNADCSSQTKALTLAEETRKEQLALEREKFSGQAAKLVALKAQLTESERSRQNEIDAHAAEIENLQIQHAAAEEALKKKNEVEFKEFRRQHRKENIEVKQQLGTATELHNAKIIELKREHDAAIASLKSEHTTAASELAQQLETLRAAAAENEQVYVAQVSQANASHAAAADALENDNAALRAKSSQDDSELERLRAALAACLELKEKTSNKFKTAFGTPATTRKADEASGQTSSAAREGSQTRRASRRGESAAELPSPLTVRSNPALVNAPPTALPETGESPLLSAATSIARRPLPRTPPSGTTPPVRTPVNTTSSTVSDATTISENESEPLGDDFDESFNFVSPAGSATTNGSAGFDSPLDRSPSVDTKLSSGRRSAGINDALGHYQDVNDDDDDDTTELEKKFFEQEQRKAAEREQRTKTDAELESEITGKPIDEIAANRAKEQMWRTIEQEETSRKAIEKAELEKQELERQRAATASGNPRQRWGSPADYRPSTSIERGSRAAGTDQDDALRAQFDRKKQAESASGQAWENENPVEVKPSSSGLGRYFSSMIPGIGRSPRGPSPGRGRVADSSAPYPVQLQGSALVKRVAEQKAKSDSSPPVIISRGVGNLQRLSGVQQSPPEARGNGVRPTGQRQTLANAGRQAAAKVSPGTGTGTGTGGKLTKRRGKKAAKNTRIFKKRRSTHHKKRKRNGFTIRL